jgi:hypothetical protein
MIFQLHRQNYHDLDVSTLVAQSSDCQDVESVRLWAEGVMRRHPLGDCEQWLLVDETSVFFWRAAVSGAEGQP